MKISYPSLVIIGDRSKHVYQYRRVKLLTVGQQYWVHAEQGRIYNANVHFVLWFQKTAFLDIIKETSCAISFEQMGTFGLMRFYKVTLYPMYYLLCPQSSLHAVSHPYSTLKSPSFETLSIIRHVNFQGFV